MTTTGKPKETFDVYREGISTEEVVDMYNRWNSYDQDLAAVNYIGPRVVAEHVEKHLQGNCLKRILDVGAGSGKIAFELSKFGYSNIDALEPAKEFLEKSEYRSLYTKCIHKYLGSQAISDIVDDEYDVIVSSGAFGEGHIPCTGLQDIIRIVKPGGYVLIAMREEYQKVKEYKGRLDPYMKELTDKGYWHWVEKSHLENFCGTKPGFLYIFQVKCQGFTDFTSDVLES